VFGKTAELIENPGPRVSAIGKLAVYPPGHAKAGQIVEDESMRARAIDIYRKASTDYANSCSGMIRSPVRGSTSALMSQGWEGSSPKRAQTQSLAAGS